MIIIEAAATGALAGVPMSVRSGWDTVRVQIDFLDHSSLYANERAPRLPITTRKKHMFARTAFYLNAWYVFVCARARGVLPGQHTILHIYAADFYLPV
jgi:hypothetical protein